jgi:hypothetical protein
MSGNAGEEARTNGRQSGHLGSDHLSPPLIKPACSILACVELKHQYMDFTFDHFHGCAILSF